MEISILEYIIGGILLVLAILLIVFVGKQQGKRHGLGNSIAGQGASESYLAKNNLGNKEKKYQKITLILAIIFVVLVLVLYIIGSVDPSEEGASSSTAATSSAAVSETSSTSQSSAAESSAVESSVAESSAVESAVESAAESTEE